jgi:hypothetical protein
MNRGIRLLLLTFSWLSLAFFLTASRISDYPFRGTRWGVAEETRRKFFRTETEAEIKKAMKKMAADIGVKCVYCHNEKNYASEEKPEKDFARTKLGLVRWLNDKYRPANADWQYSCYTCHHGRVKPVPSAPPVIPGGASRAPGH